MSSKVVLTYKQPPSMFDLSHKNVCFEVQSECQESKASMRRKMGISAKRNSLEELEQCHLSLDRVVCTSCFATHQQWRSITLHYKDSFGLFGNSAVQARNRISSTQMVGSSGYSAPEFALSGIHTCEMGHSSIS